MGKVIREPYSSRSFQSYLFKPILISCPSPFKGRATYINEVWIPLNFSETLPLKNYIFPYFFIAGSKEIFAAVEELIKNTCTGSLPGGHHSPENCDPQVLHSFPPQRPENSQVPFHSRGQKVPLLLFSLKCIGRVPTCKIVVTQLS